MKALLITYHSGVQEVFLLVGDSSKDELITYLCGDGNPQTDSNSRMNDIDYSEFISIVNTINLRDLSDLLLKDKEVKLTAKPYSQDQSNDEK